MAGSPRPASASAPSGLNIIKYFTVGKLLNTGNLPTLANINNPIIDNATLNDNIPLAGIILGGGPGTAIDTRTTLVHHTTLGDVASLGLSTTDARLNANAGLNIIKYFTVGKLLNTGNGTTLTPAQHTLNENTPPTSTLLLAAPGSGRATATAVELETSIVGDTPSATSPLSASPPPTPASTPTRASTSSSTSPSASSSTTATSPPSPNTITRTPIKATPNASATLLASTPAAALAQRWGTGATS